MVRDLPMWKVILLVCILISMLAFVMEFLVPQWGSGTKDEPKKAIETNETGKVTGNIKKGRKLSSPHMICMVQGIIDGTIFLCSGERVCLINVSYDKKKKARFDEVGIELFRKYLRQGMILRVEYENLEKEFDRERGCHLGYVWLPDDQMLNLLFLKEGNFSYVEEGVKYRPLFEEFLPVKTKQTKPDRVKPPVRKKPIKQKENGTDEMNKKQEINEKNVLEEKNE